VTKPWKRWATPVNRPVGTALLRHECVI